MDKKTLAVIGILVIGILGLVGFSMLNRDHFDYSKYDYNTIIPADEASGNLPENIEGSPDAPVILYEYGNYQCTACAPTNPYINKLKEEYGDNLAVVFRHMYLPDHSNASAAAAAANAAAIQGFWKAYKDLLFANLNEWFFATGQTRQSLFEEYFVKASDGNGDLAKFKTDMGSSAVAQKITFDNQIANLRGAEFTPAFYVDDEFVGQRKEDNDGQEITTDQFMDKLRTVIDKHLEAKGIKKAESPVERTQPNQKVDI